MFLLLTQVVIIIHSWNSQPVDCASFKYRRTILSPLISLFIPPKPTPSNLTPVNYARVVIFLFHKSASSLLITKSSIATLTLRAQLWRALKQLSLNLNSHCSFCTHLNQTIIKEEDQTVIIKANWCLNVFHKDSCLSGRIRLKK